MEYKQVQFRVDGADTIESKRTNGGIGVYDRYGELEYVICGCCGGLFNKKDVTFVRALEWVSISDKIKGE